jgi:hypothetical protein
MLEASGWHLHVTRHRQAAVFALQQHSWQVAAGEFLDSKLSLPMQQSHVDIVVFVLRWFVCSIASQGVTAAAAAAVALRTPRGLQHDFKRCIIQRMYLERRI